MVRKVAFLLVSFILFWGNSVYGEKITLAYVDFPPYEFQENGKAAGILVTIVETVFKRGNIPLELKFLPFRRAYEYTRKNEIDGLFNFYKTQKRLKFFDYSEAVIKNPLVLFVRKGSGIRFDSLKDLKGLKVGILRGYTYGTDFDESTLFVKDAGNSHESNFRKLAAVRIDVYPCDKLVGIHVAKKMNLMSELEILPVPLKIMDGHIGFTKGKHQNVINIINKIILEMHQNGEIDQIISRYLETGL